MAALGRAAGGCATAILAFVVAIAVIATTALAGVAAVFSASSGGSSSAASADAKQDIPANYLTLYQQAAATCPGLPWPVLAAIGKIETDHGRAPSMTSSAGAEGPMQFMPATWTQYGNGGNSWDPAAAIPAAARYLCANGARNGTDLRGAIFAYNHASWYVDKVLAQAAAYTAPATPAAAPGTAAATAIAYARAQIGLPYVWGGDGPSAGDSGFDCSGLVQAAYAAAGIRLPRVAQAQFDAGPKLPAGTVLLPGDLVFFGSATNIHHVGLYIGDGVMIDAPHSGTQVRQEKVATEGDLYGATRPGASGVNG